MSKRTVPDFWFEPSAWVDGQWWAGSGGEKTAVSNPATGETLAEASLVEVDTVHRAITGATAAQSIWAGIPAAERGEILKRAAILLLSRKDEFARLLTAEQGKPYPQAIGEVEYAASFFQWFGEEARRVYGHIVPHPETGHEFLVEHRPAGVAGLITPWNFPLAQGAKKIAAALAAGCSAVWKPAELTPLIALAFAPLMKEAGLPDGVLQVIPGRGAEVGKVFAEHPAIRVLSLTGSTATGRSLMAAAAQQIKRLSLELGGNAPFIILPDADLDFVAEQLTRLKLLVSGQVCVTANRIFVHAGMEEALTAKLTEKLETAKVGNGLEAGIEAGPLIHNQACAGVGALVDQAVSAGARIVYQNRTYEDQADLQAGSFFPPTLLCGVRDEMEIAREEIFGPVIPLLRYEHVTEVVQRANETPYGLAAYVYGHDLSQCRAVASRIEAGIVGVNEWRPLKAEIPFGGIKQSGVGVEGGSEGLREFLETQVISLPKQEVAP